MPEAEFECLQTICHTVRFISETSNENEAGIWSQSYAVASLAYKDPCGWLASYPHTLKPPDLGLMYDSEH